MGELSQTASVDSSDYEKHLPSNAEFTSAFGRQSDLLYARYLMPKYWDGGLRPATNDHILSFGLSGAIKGEQKYNSDKWRAFVWGKTDCMIAQAQENSRDVRWHSISDDDIDVCYLHLSPKLLEQVAVKAADRQPALMELPHRTCFKDPFLFQLGMAIKDEVEQGGLFGDIYIETASNLLAVHLLKHYCSVSFNIREYGFVKGSKSLNIVFDYIQCHLDQDISLKVLAGLVNMSEYHFARKFKEAVGQPPHQYIMAQRISKAKELLAGTDMPIHLVAMEVGYQNSHFTKMFKRVVGVTPNMFKKDAGKAVLI